MSQLTIGNFLQVRENRKNVTVSHPTETWQQVGHVETLKADIVTIRWHNNSDASFQNQPTSKHDINEVIVED
jgi:hypothetical protein